MKSFLFLVYKSCNSFVNLLPFYCFDAIVSEIVVLILFPGCCLLVYKNTNEFCTFDLYPTSLLSMFMSSNSFLKG